MLKSVHAKTAFVNPFRFWYPELLIKKNGPALYQQSEAWPAKGVASA